MKRLFTLTLIIAAVPLCTQAMTPERPKHLCETFGELAEVIMTLRQAETPISKVLQANERGIDLETASEGDRSAIKLSNGIVHAAYSEDAALSDDGKERQRKRFRNDVETRCFSQKAP